MPRGLPPFRVLASLAEEAQVTGNLAPASMRPLNAAGGSVAAAGAGGPPPTGCDPGPRRFDLLRQK